MGNQLKEVHRVEILDGRIEGSRLRARKAQGFRIEVLGFRLKGLGVGLVQDMILKYWMKGFRV